MTQHQQRFGVQCHFDMNVGGATIQSSNLLITGRPTPPPKSQSLPMHTVPAGKTIIFKYTFAFHPHANPVLGH